MSTYTPISSQTLSSAAASVTFSGIPQTYTDLVLVGAVGSTSTSFDRAMRLQFNGDTTSLYSDTDIYGEASTSASFRRSSQTQTTVLEAIARSGSYSAYTINVMNYANTTTNKTIIARSANTTLISANVGLWRNTAAINSITINLNSDNIASGSTFTLYGIGAGSPKAFGGDTVTTDGTYWYHTYRSSGIFAPMQNLSCDYLVVAGGGGGGKGASGGGGGGGGFRTSIGNSTLSLSTGSNVTVTVGAGGVGATGAARGTSGGDSTFSTITSSGGGGGAAQGVSANGISGGSGGGASYQNGIGGLGNTPNTSPSQGNNGGSWLSGSGDWGSGGGGGGASSAGGSGGGITAGAGGNGSSSSISGSSVTYAGGGGGGINAANKTQASGGTGGGGVGATEDAGENATAGTTNTGGGGGGGGETSLKYGANGGSGIVIVRYAV